MRKDKLFLMLLPLLLASCIVDSGKEGSSFASAEPSEASISGSFDFGSDPTSMYVQENSKLIPGTRGDIYHVRDLVENGSRSLLGPVISIAFGDSWVDVEVVGQEDITAGVKGDNTFAIVPAYYDVDCGILLDGRKFPGLDGNLGLHAYIPENACRNPSEAFIRFISHPKDDLDAINGYALAVVYPVGEPVEVTSEEAGFSSEELEGKKPGFVWLNWVYETVCAGISFPKVNGEYQDIDINRVNASLDIMCENAKGHYFRKIT